MEPMGTVLAIIGAPVRRRAAAQLLYCLIAAPLGLCGFLAVPAMFGLPFPVALLSSRLSAWLVPAALIVGLVLAVLLTPRVARGLGAAHRGLAARLLGEVVAAPPRERSGRGPAGRLVAGLRDGAGWRAAAYLVVKLPVAVLLGYAGFLWIGGLLDLTYPFWWGMFRNHPPEVRLGAVWVATPFPGRALHIDTFGGTFSAFAMGAAMVLAAPWVTTAAVAVDRRLIRGLLGPGRLAQRVRDLEATRARAVDASAALLRQVERDLHDGAQARLAALAMHLGMAKEKLGDPADLDQASELIDIAHRGAKAALVDLRDLARGIHPPVLDNGLADALASLAAGSAIPVELTTDIPIRPTPAIETIAYFCAAELLANAAKHSGADRVTINAAGRGELLLLSVCDNGTGGADPSGGSGLSGLAHRVSTVDGRLAVASPPGGPTRITVELPLRA
jgi:signal transduction histidine kinase